MEQKPTHEQVNNQRGSVVVKVTKLSTTQRLRPFLPMPSVLILGAGLAGLTAARALTTQSVQVTILDKGRGVGGRLATRRLTNGRADHGAPYFTAQTPDFQQQVTDWQTAGVVAEWPLEPATGGDVLFDQPRYIGRKGMNSLAKHLAGGLDVHTGERVVRLRAVAGGWQADTEAGHTFRADAICCTLPAPQALALLADSGIDPESVGVSALSGIQYQPNITVMAALNKPSAIPAPGLLRFQSGPVAWVADNQQKGISAGPTLTIQASVDFSRARLEYSQSDTLFLGPELISELMDWVGPWDVDKYEVHRWRYSQATDRYAEPLLAATTPAPLLFGGDGFGMGNVEGAYLSGRALAQWVSA